MIEQTKLVQSLFDKWCDRFRCGRCGTVAYGYEGYCSKCGAQFLKMGCPQCKRIPSYWRTATYCESCGSKLVPMATALSPIDTTTL